MILEPIPDHSTPRKCCVCMKDASLMGFNRSKLGGIDRNAKRFLCGDHAQLYAEPVSPSV